MSAPRSIALIRSYSSRAACAARAPGSDPDPSPRVIASPMCSVSCAAEVLQRLQVGVDREELDALDLGLDHPVDRVDAGAADADHADHRADRPAAAAVERSAGALGPGVRRRRSGRAAPDGRGLALHQARRECRPRTPGAGAPAARGRSGSRLAGADAASASPAARRRGRRGAAALLGGAASAGARAAASRLLASLGARRSSSAVLRNRAAQRALAHARALSGWHSRGPPSRAAGRSERPSRQDRT